MRDRDMQHVAAANPDLDERVAAWRTGHPDGTLRDAVADLGLWHNPADPDAQRLVWIILRRLGDPAAERVGFAAMRRMSVPAARDAAPVSAGPATDCAAGIPQADGMTT